MRCCVGLSVGEVYTRFWYEMAGTKSVEVQKPGGPSSMENETLVR